jgi:hypothetical protein
MDQPLIATGGRSSGAADRNFSTLVTAAIVVLLAHANIQEHHGMPSTARLGRRRPAERTVRRRLDWQVVRGMGDWVMDATGQSRPRAQTPVISGGILAVVQRRTHA